MGTIGGIVLAAGGSIRLGRPKQLLELNGEMLVHAAVRAAWEGGCEKVCVVVGHSAEAVAQAVSDLHPHIVRNDHWARGIGSSIRLGIGTMSEVSAVVLLACDQPAVNGRIVRSLIARHDRFGLAIVASLYGHTQGIPALFDHSCFHELRSLPDDRGAKSIIQAQPSRVATVDFSDGAFDLDSPEDLRVWQARKAPSQQ